MKRILSALVASALVGGALMVPAAHAEEPKPIEVPAEPNVTDPVGDANYLNDQGNGDIVGDMVTPQDVASVADIKAGWFTADADSISAHIQTEAPFANGMSVMFRMKVNPGGTESSSCLWFQAWLPGTGGPAEGSADLRDICSTAVPTSDGELILGEAADGSGLVTIKMPRAAHPAFAEGAILGAPMIHSRNSTPAASAPQIDTTLAGTEYKVEAGKVDKPKPPKPPKKKNPCKKLKGKAKKKCIKKQKDKNKPKPKKCAAYVPGEDGAEAETAVVTDAATEEKPIEVILPTEPGAGAGIGIATVGMLPQVFHNIQVDSKAKDAGLWVRVEIPEGTDYDIYLNYADGTEAAHASGFNPAPHPLINDGTGSGGHSEETAEQLDGIKSADCQGYTLDITTATGTGGDVTLKLWLGEATYDPAAA